MCLDLGHATWVMWTCPHTCSARRNSQRSRPAGTPRHPTLQHTGPHRTPSHPTSTRHTPPSLHLTCSTWLSRLGRQPGYARPRRTSQPAMAARPWCHAIRTRAKRGERGRDARAFTVGQRHAGPQPGRGGAAGGRGCGDAATADGHWWSPAGQPGRPFTHRDGVARGFQRGREQRASGGDDGVAHAAGGRRLRAGRREGGRSVKPGRRGQWRHRGHGGARRIERQQRGQTAGSVAATGVAGCRCSVYGKNVCGMGSVPRLASPARLL
jgi:hypothetical protein